jgi:hypothetical protein
MSLMSGGSLNDRLKKGRIPLEEAVQIITRLAQALEVAHSKGFIHRDLKPDNILFDQYDQAYIADFGIAHIVEATTQLTMDGATIGTPTYMSPEQVQHGKNLDGRSDIYSLGVIFYHMLTGQPPYQSDTPARTLMMHILEPVPSLLASLPELPPALENWLQTTMAKEPDDRFSTAAEMSEALQVAYRADHTVVPFPTSTQKTMSPPARRFPWAIMLILIVAIAFSIGYLAFSYIILPAGKMTETPAQASSTQEIDVALIEATETKVETLASPTPTAVIPTDTAIPASTATPEIPVASLSPSPTQELAQTATATVVLPSSPVIGGADKLAFVGGNEIWIANPDGSEARQITSSGGGSKTNLQWTPGGEAVIYVTNKCVLQVDINTEQISIILCPSWAEYVGAFQISPNGSQVALSLSDGLFVLPYDLTAISSIRTKQQLDNAEICTSYTDSETKGVRWSRSGEEIAIVTEVTDQGRATDRIKVFRIDQCGRPPIPIDEFPRSNDVMIEYEETPTITDFDWDGGDLFAMTVEKMRGFGEIYIYNMLTTRTTRLQPLQEWCCYLGFRWSPDSQYLLFAFQDIRYTNLPQFFNVIYGNIGDGAIHQPLSLPEHTLTGENPYPIFRAAP